MIRITQRGLQLLEVFNTFEPEVQERILSCLSELAEVDSHLRDCALDVMGIVIELDRPGIEDLDFVSLGGDYGYDGAHPCVDECV